MRSISQIYSEAITTRNNYLQFTELNSGRSNSKLSIMNLLTYVMACCIHTYEAILNVFQVRMVEALSGRINGTPDWYARIATKFQYNNVTETGDEIIFNEDTLKIEYRTTDENHRIIKKAAWQTGEDGQSITLKVCKANDDTNESSNGIPYMPLTDQELTAFKVFIQQIKFVGADVYCESAPGDIVTIVADKYSPIFYNDSYTTASQALTQLQQSLIKFADELTFNEMFYYQSVLDAIRKTEHISDIGTGIKVYIQPYNTTDRCYEEPYELTGRTRLKSGYIRLLDENSAITVNTDNLVLVPISQMDEYYKSLKEESYD